MKGTKVNRLKRRANSGETPKSPSSSSSSVDTDVRKRTKLCEEPQPGDIIHACYPDYEWWGICDRDGCVIQLKQRWATTKNEFLCSKHVVERDLLGYDRRERTYLINNHLDDKCPPRPVDVILSAAKEKVGEEIKCMTPSFVSELFATSLRYGLAPTKQFHEEIKPGDLVEISCTPYHHWAISVGDGYVVHLAPAGDITGSSCKYPDHRGRAVVRRELLKDVVGFCSYWVNNLFDHKFPPLPVDEIVRDAEEKIGEMESGVKARMCMRFVSFLRYGGDIKEQFHEEIKPGDLVEISCTPCHHWAISVGDGYVVHLAPPGDITGSSCKYPDHRGRAVVRRELLKDVVGFCSYWVNNLFDHKFPPLPVGEIVRDAEEKIGEMESGVKARMCMRFVSFLRYGRDIKEQVQEQPIPGDLIEIDKPGDKRWAIYEGDGYVIHAEFKKDSTVENFPTSGLSVVKRALLKDMVGDSPYQINNYLDGKYPPLSVNKILSAAKAKVDQKIFFSEWRSKDKDIITSLRYGLVSGELFWKKPKPGDVIEIFQLNKKHWAIYEGDGYIIHLAEQRDKNGSNFSTIRAVVKRELLESIVGCGHYEVKGCFRSIFSQLAVEDTLHAAKEMVGEEMKCLVWSESSEHFVNYLKFGIIYDELFCEDPKPGDIIEISDHFRHHWAIYEGAGYVIHLAPQSATTCAGSFTQDPDQSYRAVVKREPLEDVVGDSSHRVRNRFDHRYGVQPVNKILSAAKEKLRAKRKYTALDSSPKHFATYLRHGVCYDEQFCEEPDLGDLIECFSSCGQWAIYEGNGYIIHLAATGDLVQNCSLRRKAVVKRESLKKVADIYGYRVNNYLDHKHTPQPASRIVSAAQEKIGEQIGYNYGDRKFQQFFTKLRYGNIPEDQL